MGRYSSNSDDDHRSRRRRNDRDIRVIDTRVVNDKRYDSVERKIRYRSKSRSNSCHRSHSHSRRRDRSVSRRRSNSRSISYRTVSQRRSRSSSRNSRYVRHATSKSERIVIIRRSHSKSRRRSSSKSRRSHSRKRSHTRKDSHLRKPSYSQRSHSRSLSRRSRSRSRHRRSSSKSHHRRSSSKSHHRRSSSRSHHRRSRSRSHHRRSRSRSHLRRNHSKHSYSGRRSRSYSRRRSYSRNRSLSSNTERSYTSSKESGSSESSTSDTESLSGNSSKNKLIKEQQINEIQVDNSYADRIANENPVLSIAASFENNRDAIDSINDSGFTQRSFVSSRKDQTEESKISSREVNSISDSNKCTKNVNNGITATIASMILNGEIHGSSKIANQELLESGRSNSSDSIPSMKLKIDNNTVFHDDIVTEDGKEKVKKWVKKLLTIRQRYLLSFPKR